MIENINLPITVDAEIMSGEPVFRGTRVPVAALLDNLSAGISLDEFLENFPTVNREQAQKILEFSKRASRNKFLEALSKVPNTKPDEWDEL